MKLVIRMVSRWLIGPVAGLVALGAVSCKKHPEETVTWVKTKAVPKDVADTPPPDLNFPAEDSDDPNDPSDGYFRGYNKTREAEKAENPERAAALYAEALASFKKVQKDFPQWKPEMVQNRIGQTENAISQVAVGR